MLLCTRTVSADDDVRLVPTVARVRNSWLTYAPCLERFGRELRRSWALLPPEVLGDVIAMNSRSMLADTRNGGAACHTVIYLEDEAPHQRQGVGAEPLCAYPSACQKRRA
jgi:hypothetical protein